MTKQISILKKFAKYLNWLFLFFLAIFKDILNIFINIFKYLVNPRTYQKIFISLSSSFKFLLKHKLFFISILVIGFVSVFLIGYLVIDYQISKINKQNITSLIVINIQKIDQRSKNSIETKIIKGDNISKVMNRINIPKSIQRLIIKQRTFIIDKKEFNLARNLVINRKVIAFYNKNNDFLSVDFATSRKSALKIFLENKKIKYQHIYYPEFWEDQKGGGVITSSIFRTLEQNNIPESMVSHIVDIFGTDIDFSKDIHKGDSVFVTYKRLFVSGFATPKVVATAIKLTVQKRDYYAILFPDFDSDSELNPSNQKNIQNQNGQFVNLARYYYDLEGKSVIKGFLRYPLEFTRISSNFSKKRLHPVLHKYRAHTGTDFAAPTGTAVRATGDGTIKFIGRKGGYGNTIILSHYKDVETYYAHLNGFAEKMVKGKKVQQNQTIGYVGSTGLSTGPHLHYEFRKNGKPLDPLSVDLPKPPPLPSEEMSKYKKLLVRMQNQLSYAETNQFVSIE